MGSHTSPKTKTSCVRRELRCCSAWTWDAEALQAKRGAIRPAANDRKAFEGRQAQNRQLGGNSDAGCLDAGKPQLLQYMRRVASAAPRFDEVYGVIVINDMHTEYYVLKRGMEQELKAKGDPGEVAAAVLKFQYVWICI